ncbi:hypothetical protein JXQ70_08400 [bacterium]|nr:hypothetical protein [bacterium]
MIKSLHLAPVFFLIGLLTSISAVAADVIVIVHPSVSVDNLNIDELKDFYLGKKSLWDKNTKVLLTTLKDSPATSEFLEKYIGKTTTQFQNFWNKLLFSGKGVPPTMFKDEKSLVEYISQKEGAIGFVSKDQNLEKVKKITITQ